MAKGYKTGGREAGTLNKTTSELRNTIQSFIEKNIDEMQKNFDLLEPKDKLMFIEKLLNYTLPKAHDLIINDNRDLQPPVFIFKKFNNEIPCINVSKQFPDK